MTKLHLSSLTIKQFRTFGELEIPRLGQVNLITGKNAVGKTALLESLRLFADSGSPRSLRQILVERDELYRLDHQKNSDREPVTEVEVYESVRNLFHDRPDIDSAVRPIQIGPEHQAREQLSITPVLLIEEIGEDRIRRYRKANQHQLFEGIETGGRETTAIEQIPGIIIQSGNSPELMVPLSRLVDRRSPMEVRPIAPRLPAVYVPTEGPAMSDLTLLWEQITLTELESYVRDALNVVSPEMIEGINIVSGAPYRTSGTVIVRTKTTPQPLPLRSLGEGMVRAFVLSLALVNAKDGLLLVDEIDSGLHYSVQYEIWKLIFQVARRLNIQVFATTHSWDAVESFQQAAADNTDAEGMLIRLERSGDEIVSTLFDEARLAIVTRAQIEVR